MSMGGDMKERAEAEKRANSGRVVFFDMDGVLADFVSGLLRKHDKFIPPHLVEWDFCTQVGFEGGGDPKFWEPLSNAEFWAGLDVLPDGMELFRRVEAVIGKDRIGFLSSGLCPGSCDGKRTWLDKHLPGYGKAAVFCNRKNLVAAPGKVLLDDFESNATGFIEAGGSAVLIPRAWNVRKSQSCPLGLFDVDRVMDELGRLISGW